MSETFTEHEDFLESDVELDDNGLTGIVLIPGQIAFIDAVEMGQVDDYDPRYQVTCKTPKGSDAFKNLIAVIDHIGRKTWKGEADAKLEAIWDCIDKGISPKQSEVSIQDGDLHQPEYNAGCWQWKCSRREDEGRPMIFDVDGQPIYAPNDLDEDTGVIVNGELIGDESQVPAAGDMALVMIRVWAQKKRERINFSFQGIRFVSKGGGSQRAVSAQAQTASIMGGDVMPALPASAGSDEGEVEEAQPTRKSSAKKSARKVAPKKSAAEKAAPKKGAAKKAAAKTRGSVFKKRGARK